MLTLFNRKELLTTFSMEEQNRVRDILAQHHIDYRVRVRSIFGDVGRRRNGSFGMNPECAYQYYIYVHRKDYDRARFLI